MCSAINCTQKHVRCTLGGHLECKKPGLHNIGLLIPDPEHKLMSGTAVRSSNDECASNGTGPCTWQLPPNGPVPLVLRSH